MKHVYKEFIYDKDSRVIGRSKNLRGIRRYVCRPGIVIETLDVSPVKTDVLQEASEWNGGLAIVFTDGSFFRTTFASLGVLIDWVRRWRPVHGAPLTIKGLPAGVVSKDNPELLKLRDSNAHVST